jgi:Peptidase family M23
LCRIEGKRIFNSPLNFSMSNSPDLRSPFFRYLMVNNRPHLDNFKKWIFQPGMLFNSPYKWWGDQGVRSTPHEGLDLYSYEDNHEAIKILDTAIKIPAAFAGEIVKIEPDFLGKSIYISHEIFAGPGRQLFSAYGHTAPLDFIRTGARVAEGETIAVISEGSGKKGSIMPHLHITFAWISTPIALDDLNWGNLGKNPGITPVDPLLVLEL